MVNGQEASIVSSQNNTIILELPEGQRIFVCPVTHLIDDRCVTYYPFTPAYVQTITKLQGQNIKTSYYMVGQPPRTPRDSICVGLLHTF